MLYYSLRSKMVTKSKFTHSITTLIIVEQQRNGKFIPYIYDPPSARLYHLLYAQVLNEPVLNMTIPLRQAYSVGSTRIALNLAMISCSAAISVIIDSSFSGATCRRSDLQI